MDILYYCSTGTIAKRKGELSFSKIEMITKIILVFLGVILCLTLGHTEGLRSAYLPTQVDWNIRVLLHFICVYVYCLCEFVPHKCSYPLRPDKSIRSPGAGVTGICDSWNMDAGNQTLSPLKACLTAESSPKVLKRSSYLELERYMYIMF